MVVVPVRNEIVGKLYLHRSFGITAAVVKLDRRRVFGINRVCEYLFGALVPERCEQPHSIFMHCVTKEAF